MQGIASKACAVGRPLHWCVRPAYGVDLPLIPFAVLFVKRHVVSLAYAGPLHARYGDSH